MVMGLTMEIIALTGLATAMGREGDGITPSSAIGAVLHAVTRQ